jgi:aspartyl-tRNA(Asn)/glutamyl-tRNA(Gln) amidotransferase subunit C
MDIKDVENLAELARLDLSTEEKEAILRDMDGILEYVKTIEQVEVGDVEPEYDLKNVWREDDPKDEDERGFSPALVVGQFPDKQDGFLKVKKIL